MHIEFLVEEVSVEVALHNLVPRIVGPDVSYAIHSHQGKQDLLTKLPSRLRAYRTWIPDDWYIVVLVDADSDDCRILEEVRARSIIRVLGNQVRRARRYALPGPKQDHCGRDGVLVLW